MTKASENPYPFITLVEQATTPSNPASGRVKLWMSDISSPPTIEVEDTGGANYVVPYEDDVILKSVLTAKGDLVVALTASSASVLPVASTDGYILSADSAEASGLKWISNSSASAGLGAVTINAQTGSYTLVAGDASKLVTVDASTATTITVPDTGSVSWATGSRIGIASLTTYSVTIAGTGSTTLKSNPGNVIDCADGAAAAELIYYGSNNWLLIGRLTT